MHRIQPYAPDLETLFSFRLTGAAPNYPTAWLPTARVARAWEALVTEKPFTD
jgi:hypothetical protein